MASLFEGLCFLEKLFPNLEKLFPNLEKLFPSLEEIFAKFQKGFANVGCSVLSKYGFDDFPQYSCQCTCMKGSNTWLHMRRGDVALAIGWIVNHLPWQCPK